MAENRTATVKFVSAVAALVLAAGKVLAGAPGEKPMGDGFLAFLLLFYGAACIGPFGLFAAAVLGRRWIQQRNRRNEAADQLR